MKNLLVYYQQAIQYRAQHLVDILTRSLLGVLSHTLRMLTLNIQYEYRAKVLLCSLNVYLFFGERQRSLRSARSQLEVLVSCSPDVKPYSRSVYNLYNILLTSLAVCYCKQINEKTTFLDLKFSTQDLCLPERFKYKLTLLIMRKNEKKYYNQCYLLFI